MAARIDQPTGPGIASAVGRLVSSGELPPDDRLPTVRALARALGVSPTTVSDAWRRLGSAGLIETGGARGTRVASRPGAATVRFARLHQNAERVLDLSTGTPDPLLLPDVATALARTRVTAATASYFDDPVLPELDRLLRADWPFAPERVTVTDGALDALARLFDAKVRLGDRVAIETPTFAPILDMLEACGAQLLAVRCDEQGPIMGDLAAALSLDPVAFVLQPRAHNPCGHSLTPERAAQLASLLAPTTVLVIEDDSAGYVSNDPAVSLGQHLPEHTVLIRSFSKSHGPDLRLAAAAGAASPIESIAASRQLGPGWSSRLLQSVLVAMLTADDHSRVLAFARDQYGLRRAALREELERRGITVGGGDGVNVWVPVADERAAVLSLAGAGISVAPGSPFDVMASTSDHIRVTIAPLRDPDQIPTLADAIAVAAQGGRKIRGG